MQNWETFLYKPNLTNMKKILLFTFSLLLVTGIAAQDEQNTESSNKDTSSPNMWLGGEVTFGSMSNLDFTLGPNFGLMINESMGVGGSLYFSSGDNAYGWGFEPYFRYYIPIVDQFAFYGDAFIGIGGGDNSTETDGGDYSILDFGARAGLQYWITPRWSVAASTNVLTYTSTNNEGEFGMGVNFNSVLFSLFFHF
jgi:hypothetical protein